MPIPRMRTLEFLGEIAKIVFPDAWFAEKHTSLTFTLLAIGAIIYGFLMLDDDVDNWKTALQVIVFWFIAATLGSGFLISAIHINASHEGETFSKLFIFGMLTIPAAYVAISIGAWWVRDSWIVRGIATLIAIARIADCIMWTQALIA